MEFADLCGKLQTIINSPVPMDMSPIRAWVEWGADPMLDIIPAIERTMNRIAGTRSIRSMRYFDAAIKQAMDDRKRNPPTAPSGTSISRQELPIYRQIEKANQVEKEYILSASIEDYSPQEQMFIRECVHIQSQYMQRLDRMGFRAMCLYPPGADETKRRALWEQVMVLCRAALRMGRVQDPLTIDRKLWE